MVHLGAVKSDVACISGTRTEYTTRLIYGHPRPPLLTRLDL